MKQFYISYADEKDGHFIGACIVCALEEREAIWEAIKQGCKASDQYYIVPVPETEPVLNEHNLNRVMELDELERLLGPMDRVEVE